MGSISREEKYRRANRDETQELLQVEPDDPGRCASMGQDPREHVRWWAAVVPRAVGAMPRRSGKLARRLPERKPRPRKLEGKRVLLPQSSFQPCATQLPLACSGAELHSMACAGGWINVIS